MKTNHDGDCFIYAVNGICTCGLLHRIARNPGSDEFKSREEEMNRHHKGLYFLNHTTIPEPSAESLAEAEALLKKMFGY